MKTLAELARKARQEDAYKLAARFALRAQRVRRHYQRVLDRAIAKYGDVHGTPTSGIYNPAFPEATKRRLRFLLLTANALTESSRDAYKKTGKRTPWRDELGRVAKPAWSFY